MLDKFDDRLDPTFKPANPGRLIRRLRAVLPKDGLITEPEGLRPYESDGFTGYKVMPAVVAMPRICRTLSCRAYMPYIPECI